MIINIINGIVSAFIFPGSSALLGKWACPSDRTKMSGYYYIYINSIAYSGTSLAVAIANPIAGVICDNIGWRYVYYIYCSITIVVVIIFYMYLIDLFRFIYSSPSEDPFINEEEKKYIEEDFLKKNVFYNYIYIEI